MKIKFRASSLIILSYLLVYDINIILYEVWGFSKENFIPFSIYSLITNHFINLKEQPLMQTGVSMFENKCVQH